jgi:uncharacterized protein YjeT (DUF2065 family)
MALVLCSSLWGQTPPSGTGPKKRPAPTATTTNVANTQDQGPPLNADPYTDGGAQNESDLWRYITSYEFALAVLVLLFGVLVILSASMTLKGKSVTPEQALRFYGVIVILIGTILLIVAGLSNNQIAPAVGLFGTLAGYLLGKNQSSETGAQTGSKSGAADENAKE